MRTRAFLKILTVWVIVSSAVASAGAPGDALTVSDLQHHRWILESINGTAHQLVDGLIPELDFGEQMHVSGNTGCNQMTGKGELQEGSFLVLNMAVTRRMCAAPRDEIERTVLRVLGKAASVSIDEEKNLILTTDDVTLLFRLRDWVS